MVNDILYLIGLDWDTLMVALVSALSGTIVLSGFATPLGRLSYPVNFLVLFVGAVAASGTLHKLGWTLEGALERQLLASFSGMALVAIAMIRVSPRSRGR